jgi:transcription initiation factor TFIIIB Brf1 subunit/transcription initiation factor TFIIB
VKTTRLALPCPVCKSQAVFYSCTPNCCFNHVCSDCGTTFEPATAALGQTLSGIEPPDPLPDTSDPTVACVKCDATAVYALADGRLVCAKCGAVLKLEIEEVSPG